MKSMLRWVLAGALLATGGQAIAQNWPVKPVRLIVPTPPGGTLDWISRALGDQFQQRFKEPAIVEKIGRAHV